VTAQYDLKDGVAVISLDNPPVNGLGWSTRRAAVELLDRAAADPGIAAVVLTGAGKAFSAGADIREFNTPKAAQAPTLYDLLAAVEASPKPIVAAINALALGGGLELALAAHYRVASPETQVGLPEVKIGVLPGAGGTQRLPRAVGLEIALNMIVAGTSIRAADLGSTRLFDRLIEGDMLGGALAFAREVVARGGPHPLIRDWKVEHPNPDGYLAFARRAVVALAKNFPAPLKCIDAVAASVSKPFEEGLREERAGFFLLVQTTESKSLRHAFFAERAAAKIPDVGSEVTPRRISNVAVIGAGTMGGGIATAFLNAGFPVTLLEADQRALDKGLETLRGEYQKSVKKGKLTISQTEERLGRLKSTLCFDDLRSADLVIEAVFEDYAVKEGVFRKLDAVAHPGAILATNTSTLDVNRIAAITARPQDVLGMHFFSPAHVMRLLEVVRAAKTAPEVLATVVGLAPKIRKVAVVSGVCDGFIGNRMIEQYMRQALFLLDEGGLPEQVDRAMEEFGFAMGPFRMSDLAGNDIGWAIRKRRAQERPAFVYSRTADLLCERGRFGQKTDAGWYDYRPGERTAYPSQVVAQMLREHARSIGMSARRIEDEEIVGRLVYALVNEGARILEEGIAARASDIDTVYLNGYGFPLHRGGPMFYADTVGPYNVLRSMRRFGRGYQGGAWEPAPLIERLAESGGTFSGSVS
jgi:3-hydroxyacyl-CoA dehydrogenase